MGTRKKPDLILTCERCAGKFSSVRKTVAMCVHCRTISKMQNSVESYREAKEALIKLQQPEPKKVFRPRAKTLAETPEEPASNISRDQLLTGRAAAASYGTQVKVAKGEPE